MATPDRVRQAAREADQQLRDLAAAGVIPGGPIVDPNAPPGNEPPPAPPSPDDHFTPGPHPNAIDPPAPAPDEPVDESGNLITPEAFAQLQQKLDTALGTHNRDVALVAELRGRLEVMERLMLAKQNTAEPAPAPAPPAKESLVTAAEEKEFGADLIDVMRKVVKEEMGPFMNQYYNELTKLNTAISQLKGITGQVAQVTTDMSMQQFNRQLDALVQDASGNPDWHAIDNSADAGDRRFLDWLAQTGEDSDQTRLVVLQSAYQRKDSAKCAAMFNAFKRSVGMATGPQSAPTTPVPTAANPAAAIVSPSPVAPAPAPSTRPGQKKVWKLADVEQIYTDKTKGKFRGREAEFARLVAETDLATVEGRVVR